MAVAVRGGSLTDLQRASRRARAPELTLQTALQSHDHQCQRLEGNDPEHHIANKELTAQTAGSPILKALSIAQALVVAGQPHPSGIACLLFELNGCRVDALGMAALRRSA